jgi:hypothetical protein
MTDGMCPFAYWVKGVTHFDKGYADRVGFADHTAGGFYSTLTTPSFWNGEGLSVHFAISRKGDVAQIVNIFDTAYAQGLTTKVTWPPYAQMGYRNPNGYLISTEHEDAVTVDGHTVFIAGSEWTPEQYDADLRVKRWCIEEVKRVTGHDMLTFGLDSLAGHHMFDPVNRAECPGRLWREQYRASLFADLTPSPVPAPVPLPDWNGVLVAGAEAAIKLRRGEPLDSMLQADKEALKAVTDILYPPAAATRTASINTFSDGSYKVT